MLKRITSENVAKLSVILWIASMPLIGISAYSDEAKLFGIQILLMGWLSPLVLNFAWFANVFYLYGVLKTLKGKAAYVSSILSTIISLDTFRYDEHLLNEGGATSPVYGYGWGAYWCAPRFVDT